MITEPQPAFLLHSRPYQDHKQLVEFFTPIDGKVAAVVYVGKSLKSNKKPLLQPFLPLTIQIKGQHQLKTLQTIEAQGKSLALVANNLYCGFYINELLVRLLPELIPCESLFQLYQQLIKRLVTEVHVEPLLREFELALLTELGIGLNFEQLESCQGSYVSFNMEHGFEQSAGRSESYLKSDLLAFAENQLQHASALSTAKRLMRYIINQLLGHQPLNSRKLFEKRV
ncbi:DNA repair protein RecO [Colwellia sp. MEBiC06753]